VMLRHLGEHGGGVDVYTRRVLDGMLRQPGNHEFVFLYRDPDKTGSFGRHPNLREVVVDAPAKLLWDQVAVPLAARREKIDLLFNPKYSLPLVGGPPGVFVLHGIDWYQMPWGSRWLDRLSHRHLVPRYVARANQVICVSESVRSSSARSMDDLSWQPCAWPSTSLMPGSPRAGPPSGSSPTAACRSTARSSTTRRATSTTPPRSSWTGGRCTRRGDGS